ncbi:MAG TPA: hypothetical protein VML53_08020 [Thermoplasmata archaeon]|nr:hypothetical protein [Thermoplasmata archaeon]
MSAASAWFVSVVALLALVVALHQLGVNASAELGSALWGTLRMLGQPLVLLP